jgi:putative peptidoglycan lipid II flippase
MTATSTERATPVTRDTVLMAVGTLLSRATGLARLFALAFVLGVTNRLADSYNLANTTPNIIYDLVAGGVMSATLIPVFVERLSTRTRKEAWRGISAVATLATVVLLAASVLLAVVAPLIVRIYTAGSHSFSPDARAVTTVLLQLFAPQVALYGFITLMTALLNTRRRFAAPMFVPIVNNLVVIAIAFGLYTVATHPTVQGVRHDHALLLLLGLGTTAGVLFQALALVPSVLGARVYVRWVWQPRHEAVLTVLRLSSWTFGFVAANQVALFVSLALAARQTGGATAWTYAYIFFQLPYGIIAVSVMSGIQPDLAEQWTVGDLGRFRHHLAAAMRATLAVIVPAAFGYIVLARPVVSLVIGHGATSAAGVHLTAQVLTMFSLGLPGFCTFLLLMRAYQAMQNTRRAFYLYLVENGINVVLAFALYVPLGVRGLALALSVAYTVATFVALVDLGRLIGGVEGRAVLQALVRALALSVLMAAAVAVVAAEVGSDHGPGLVLKVVVSLICGVSVYFLTAGLVASVGDRLHIGAGPGGPTPEGGPPGEREPTGDGTGQDPPGTADQVGGRPWRESR